MTLTLRLTPKGLARSRSIAPIVRAKFKGASQRLVASFEFKTNERAFAIALLERKPNYWIFRTHQSSFCGDFIVVDMASTRADKREACVIDLKMNAPLRVNGGAGNQFINAEKAVKDLVREQICGDSFVCLSGSKNVLLDTFGVRRN